MEYTKQLNKLLYSTLFLFSLVTSANALSVHDILGLDMARMMRDGKTDTQIKAAAQRRYERLQHAGVTDEEIKLLSKRTYQSEKEYRHRSKLLSK